MDAMKEKFEAQAAPGAVFGSGWVWVCVNKKGDKLEIVGTPNQDNPLMKGVSSEIMYPILGLDVCGSSSSPAAAAAISQHSTNASGIRATHCGRTSRI